MTLVIDIAVEHDAWFGLGDWDALARRAVAAAVAESGTAVPEQAELSLVLCGDAFIRGLNRTWRGKDEPTNVLSFPTDAAARDMALGDIIIAYETSAREAAKEGKPLADHFVHLVVHGFFHLLGFDHQDDAEADAMERLESRTLMALGIASPHQHAEDVRAHP